MSAVNVKVADDENWFEHLSTEQSGPGITPA